MIIPDDKFALKKVSWFMFDASLSQDFVCLIIKRFGQF